MNGYLKLFSGGGSGQFTFYTMRWKGQAGWALHWDHGTISEIHECINLNGKAILDAREITYGWTGGRLEEPYLRFYALDRGWAYDPYRKWWRAPEEPVTEPAGNPPLSEQLDVSFKAPKSGWLPFLISSGKIRVEIDCSDVYDPLPELLIWLETLVEGKQHHFIINEEGHLHEFRTFPLPCDKIRLVILIHLVRNIPGETMFDLQFPRKILVAKMYQALMEIGKIPAIWHQWCDQPGGGISNVARPPYRSATVEKYLAKE